MAIKGLTDRGMAFPEIGSIRKGAPKEEGKNRPGADLQHFRVEFDQREKEAEAIFRAKYGNEPKEIIIVLPFDEIERMWDAWYEAYSASRLIARSDGERFVYLVNPTTGEVEVRSGQPFRPHQDEIYGQKMKATGRLKVVIPELARMAYLTVHTTSVYDVLNISQQLEAVKHINGGKLAGVTLVLRRRPQKISTPAANGQRARREKWLISIEADPKWVKAKLVQMKHLALPGNGLALLPEPEEHDEPEIEDEPPAEWDDDDESIEGEVIDAPDMVDEAEAMGGEVAEKAPEIPEAVKKAMAIKMIDGSTLGDLNDSQLEDKIANLKAGGLKTAAQTLLDWRIKNGVHK